jgi:hypothetical protein
LNRVIRSGCGWRIGWRTGAEAYPGLIGTDDWACELTSQEFSDFCQLLAQLVANVRSIESELMDSEKIACEAETENLWLQIEGEGDRHSLRVILNTGRRFEGNWPPTAVTELTIAAANLSAELKW